MKKWSVDGGEANDVHSKGHLNGDGGVVGVVVKASGRHGRTEFIEQCP